MRQLIQLVVYSSTVLLLAGCALLPDPRIPDPGQPNALRNGVVYNDQDEDFSHYAWWKRFNDEILNGLVDDALASNNEIQLAISNVQQAEAQLQAAKFAWLPTLNLQGGGVGAGAFDSSVTPRNIGTFSGTRNNIISAAYGGFVPSYSLNIFSVLNQTRIAEASLEIRRAAYNSVRLTVIGQVCGGYFTLISSRQQEALQKKNIAHLEVLYQVELKRYHAGSTSYQAVVEAQQRLDNSKSNLESVKNSISQSENALMLLAGKNPGTIETNIHPVDYVVDRIIPDNLPSKVLLNRPDVIMAENNLRVTYGQIGLANAAFFPDISITGIGGLASVFLSSIASGKTGFWLASGAVSMPLLDAKKTSGISAAEAAKNSAVFNYMQTIKSAFADVDDQFTAVMQSTKSLAHTSSALEASIINERLSNSRFKAGATDSRARLEAQIQRNNAELLKVAAKQQQLTSHVLLFQSLAAGYDAK